MVVRKYKDAMPYSVIIPAVLVLSAINNETCVKCFPNYPHPSLLVQSEVIMPFFVATIHSDSLPLLALQSRVQMTQKYDTLWLKMLVPPDITQLYSQ